MKPTALELSHSLSSVQDKTRMSIDENSLAHLMSVLTNLYADPILAVIREYSTNALDSHIEAGITDPIEVTLPTRMAPNFIVKDHGVGLSVGDLRDVYSMYGKSTKRGSDEATGMLGLGCKSGLTYTLAFTVSAVKDGVKTIASVAKDSDGVGTIKVLDTSGTDEPNGVTVSIPVKDHDVQAFRNKANGFYKFWRNGSAIVDKEPSGFDTDGWLLIDDDVAVKTAYGESNIVMGGVAYPFQSPLRYCITTWVPIGAVNFTPSREALHMTARTKQTIDEIKQFCETQVEKIVKDKLTSAAGPVEKLRVAAEWRWVQTAQDYIGAWHKAIKIDKGEGRPTFEVQGDRATKDDTGRVGDNRVLDKQWSIVTNFPFKGVSPLHKERLRLAELDRVVLLPEVCDITGLSDRDDVYDWEDIVEFTKTNAKASIRLARSKTVYTWKHQGAEHVGSLIPDDAPILYHGPREYVKVLFPEARVVCIYANQVNKFLRLHPKAERWEEYFNRKRSKVAKAINEADQIFLTIEGDWYMKNNLTSLQPHIKKLEDPDLVKLVVAQRDGKESDRLKAWRSFGSPPLPDHSAGQKMVKAAKLRYPLVFGSYNMQNTEDCIIYMNAKFTTIQ